MQNLPKKNINSELYDVAARENVAVIACALPRTHSVSVMDEAGQCAIGMDTALCGRGERTHLAHELGHCLTGSFYEQDSPDWYRERCEYKANKWAIRHLVPRASLRLAAADGATQCWQLAEIFGVTEEFMQKAIDYYKDVEK